MTRRQTRTRSLLLSGLATGALLLPACGNDTVQTGGPGDAPPSSGAEATPTLSALQLDVSGGFVPVETAFSSVPQLTVTPDGQVITGAPVLAIYPGPLLVPLTTRSLDDEGRAALARLVVDSGLVRSPAPDLGTPNVADAPTTTLTVTLDGVTTTVVAPALGATPAPVGAPADGSLTEEQQALRADLQALVDQLGDLSAVVGAEHLGPEEAYVPEALWLQASPATDVEAEGTVADEGTDEPAPTVVDWPVADVDLATLEEATRVDGPAAAAALDVLADATTLTRFRQGGEVYQVLARPALPGVGV